MKAAMRRLHTDRQTQSGHRLVTRHEAAQQFRARCVARLCRREHGRNDDGAGMDDRRRQEIVQLEKDRIIGLWGRLAGYHADVVQPGGGVKELRIDGLTGSSHYNNFYFRRETNPLGPPISVPTDKATSTPARMICGNRAVGTAAEARSRFEESDETSSPIATPFHDDCTSAAITVGQSQAGSFQRHTTSSITAH